MNLTIREARVEESPRLAELMNIAGEGLPAHLWASMAGSAADAMALGARRVARPEGAFSHANAYVATSRGEIAGMLLSYRLPDDCESEPMDEVPAVVRPLLALEALVPGSWYVNAVATAPAYRGQGVGSALMQLAEQLAMKSGADALSLIVAEENVAARRLYERLGYQEMARQAIIQFPGCPHTGDWVLMKKALGHIDSP